MADDNQKPPERKTPEPMYGFGLTVMPSEFADIRLTPVTFRIDENNLKAVVTSDLLINSTVVLNLKALVGEEELNLFGEVLSSAPVKDSAGQFEINVHMLFMTDARRAGLKKFLSMAARLAKAEDESIIRSGKWEYFGFRGWGISSDSTPMGLFFFIGAIAAVFVSIIAFFFVVFRYIDTIRLF